MQLREFHKSNACNKIEEVRNTGDEVLIQDDNTQRTNLRVGVIRPSGDGIKRIADTYNS